jgi:hypothetical protein
MRYIVLVDHQFIGAESLIKQWGTILSTHPLVEMHEVETQFPDEIRRLPGVILVEPNPEEVSV